MSPASVTRVVTPAAARSEKVREAAAAALRVPGVVELSAGGDRPASSNHVSGKIVGISSTGGSTRVVLVAEHGVDYLALAEEVRQVVGAITGFPVDVDIADILLPGEGRASSEASSESES